MGEYRAIIGENIRKICKLKGIKYIDIARHLGISSGSVSNWIKGTNSIDIENLALVCDFLGVSLDQIYGKEPMPSGEFVSPEEAELLKCFRAMNKEARAAIMTTARGMAGNPEMKKEDGSAATA